MIVCSVRQEPFSTDPSQDCWDLGLYRNLIRINEVQKSLLMQTPLEIPLLSKSTQASFSFIICSIMDLSEPHPSALCAVSAERLLLSEREWPS